MNKKTVRNIEVTGKKVLLRVDFNVPLEGGRIINDTKMKGALPTVKFLQEKGAKILIVTHLGRPKGKIVPEMSTGLLVDHLGVLLSGAEVMFAADCGGEASQTLAAKMKPGQVALLENVRFYPEEEKNDPGFAKSMASLADVYVNDAFGTAHRAHASTEGVAKYLPAVAGFLMEKEIRALSSALENPEKPFAAIIGGAKASDKIPVIENLLDKVDTLLIGGGLANTFLKAQGYDMGKSLVEEDKVELAREILAKAQARRAKVILPRDVVSAGSFAADAPYQATAIDRLPRDWMVMDIGQATVQTFIQVIRQAKTILWNGPLGVYEFASFAAGTNQIAQALADNQAKTIVGGGDVVAAVEKAGVAERIYHISTGGGASLEFLEGQVLPGIAALQDQ